MWWQSGIWWTILFLSLIVHSLFLMLFSFLWQLYAHAWADETTDILWVSLPCFMWASENQSIQSSTTCTQRPSTITASNTLVFFPTSPTHTQPSPTSKTQARHFRPAHLLLLWIQTRVEWCLAWQEWPRHENSDSPLTTGVFRWSCKYGSGHCNNKKRFS